ncbi:5'-nucleotidase SurE [Deltaproteobacteria bacterium]|nr:5'-nucleotidase SurE [Deltaproteobacteria bacterium]
MFVALTNDDGIMAAGLRGLYKALLDAGHTVSVIAPQTEQSASGQAITVRIPLRAKRYEEDNFTGTGIAGTPADCVKLGLSVLIKEKIDIVLSGINAGANTGPDILYSGTVAAAREAAGKGYPAMALSCASFGQTDLAAYARYSVTLMETIPWQRIPAGRVINVNFPDLPFEQCKGIKICPHAHVVWDDWYEERLDMHAVPYWWLNGKIPPERVAPGTDRALLSEGYITISPLPCRCADEEGMLALRQCGLS